MRKSRNQRVTQANRWQTGLGLFVGLIIFATVSVISFRLPAIAQEDTRAVGTVSIESTQPGELAVSWDAPTETPRDYRISWARADQDYPSREDSTRQCLSYGYIVHNHRSGRRRALQGKSARTLRRLFGAI